MQYFNSRMQEYIEEYRRKVEDGELAPMDIAEWIIAEKGYEPTPQETLILCAREVSRAMRTQFYTDPDGNRVRRKYAVRRLVTQADGSQKMMPFWCDIDIATPQFMLESFRQQREQVADYLWRMKQNAESYNKFYNKSRPVQIEMNFAEDMKLRGFSGDYPPDPDDDEPI
ncbi:MAG: hypothetical protein ABSE62_15360 [Chthoniobacteraceae bacterium]|jgi:hypothetical protein